MLALAAFIGFFLALWGALALAGPLVRAGLDRTARLTRAVPARGPLPLMLLLGVGAVVALLAAEAFIELAERVATNNPGLRAFDQRWHDLAVSHRSPGATTFFAAMSFIGGPLAQGVVAGVAALGLLLLRRVWWSLYLVVTAAGGGLLNRELKGHFERARPALAQMLRRAHGFSFPSGHATASTVVLGALAYLCVRALPRWGQQAAAIALAVTLVVAVSASRVYLGAHWLSDVGAGAAVGVVWLSTTVLGAETLRLVRARSVSTSAR